MNSTMWTYFFILVGILGIVLINLFSHILLSNEQNDFLIKEITEAAMEDSIDENVKNLGIGWDGVTSVTDPKSMHCMKGSKDRVRILKEKFVESFVRRFSEAVGFDKRYTITFHDIDECPPKVSLTVSSRENFNFLRIFNVDHETIYGQENPREDIKNSISGIIESDRIQEEN